MKVEHFENTQPVFLIGIGIFNEKKKEVDVSFSNF